ncbi:unnamed protein product [Pseudo-nitzschia multistriata]|uniref:Uncharacterized protein n=1 Tax=Pseudo-nitzschia multistriata TaxID=183589 RepID=A0A448ZEQ1_9STRA|nr:unnamed protein product [Pseudo-nitzschia multistriata]
MVSHCFQHRAIAGIALLLLGRLSASSGLATPRSFPAKLPSDLGPWEEAAAPLPGESRRGFLGAALGVCLPLALGGAPSASLADEYGRETEAPTLATGESFEICTKRGPLGACQKTEVRTASNDNDKAEKYFRQPTELVRRKDTEARTAEATEGNVLIERLKKQSEENSEKNELLVYQRTLLNDSSASFGPFDGQVLILNEDGRGFTLLANPQAMRLKKAGLIENNQKKFVRQPTKEELDAALAPEPAGPGFLDRFLGGGP